MRSIVCGWCVCVCVVFYLTTFPRLPYTQASKMSLCKARQGNDLGWLNTHAHTLSLSARSSSSSSYTCMHAHDDDAQIYIYP